MWGAILNTRNVFYIDIEEDETIADFQKKMRKACCYWQYSADDLTFFLAKKNGKWLRRSDPDVRRLDRGKFPDTLMKLLEDSNAMNPQCRVSEFNFRDKEDVRSNEYHILLEIPKGKIYHARRARRRRERAEQRRKGTLSKTCR